MSRVTFSVKKWYMKKKKKKKVCERVRVWTSGVEPVQGKTVPVWLHFTYLSFGVTRMPECIPKGVTWTSIGVNKLQRKRK